MHANIFYLLMYVKRRIHMHDATTTCMNKPDGTCGYSGDFPELTFCNICFVHTIFRLWFLVTFGDKITKLLHNLCLHFARQDGQDGKKTERKS